MAAGLHGQVGLAVAPLGAGTVHVFGSVRIAHAWSTSKVPVLVTLLHDYEGSGQRLSPSENDDATLALEQSDNAAIEALFGVLEQIHGGLVPASAAVQARLRAAGDETTTINTAPNDEGFTTYGQSEWSLPGEVTFYRALARGCLLESGGHQLRARVDAQRRLLPALGRRLGRLPARRVTRVQGRLGARQRRQLSGPADGDRGLRWPRLRDGDDRACPPAGHSTMGPRC